MPAADYLRPNLAERLPAAARDLARSVELAPTPEDWMTGTPGVAEAARFGAIDTSLLVIGATVGAALDDHLAKITKAPGFGPILGAVAANTLGALLGAGREGWRPVAGVLLGSGAAMIPVLAAITLGKPAKGGTSRAVVGASALVLGLAYLRRRA